MNIFDNLIKDTEIIGISALTSNDESRGTTEDPYTSFVFKVYLKNTQLAIYSPEFSKSQVQKKDAWLKKYLVAREAIAQQIGELTQNS